MSEGFPTLSIGLAVRNRRHMVRRCIDSVLSQTFTDLELVVSDNVSDDGTVSILEDYAKADRRIKLNRNAVDIGIHQNMRRVLELSRGRFFRWISSDDWLEPECLSACVRALQDREDAIGVTTWFTIHTRDGSTRFEEYDGEFPDSPDPARRFERMLWFFHAGDAKYDPMYGVYRRDQLIRNPFPRPSERTDWLTVAELALVGPILNLRQRLANRTRDYTRGIDPVEFRRVLDPDVGERLKTSARCLHRELHNIVLSAHLNETQLLRCERALQRFWIKERLRDARARISDVRHRMFAS